MKGRGNLGKENRRWDQKKRKKKAEGGRAEIFFFFLASAGKVTSGGRGLRALERWRPGANPLSQLPCVPGVQGPAGSKVCAYVGCCKARQKKNPSVADNDSWHRVRWRWLTPVVTSLAGKSITFSCLLLAATRGARRDWPQEDSSAKVRLERGT